MNFRTYAWSVFFGCVFSLAAWLGLIAYQWDAPVVASNFSQFSNAEKLRLAREIPDRKILVVSGSNSFYGVSASLLQQETGISAINMAVNAGMYLPYQLERIKPLLHRGDIVLMPLEYQFFQQQNLSDIFINHVITQDVAYFWKLPLNQQRQVLSGVKIRDLLERTQYKWKKSPLIPPDFSFAINSHGDYLNSFDANISELTGQGRVRNIISSPFTPEPLDFKVQPLLSDFQKWCSDRGVILLAAYPSGYLNQLYTSAEIQSLIKEITAVYKACHIPVLGQPRDSNYDPESLFDFAYHVVDGVRQSRTLNLIRRMEPYLGEGALLVANEQGFYDAGRSSGWTTGEARFSLPIEAGRKPRLLKVAIGAVNPRRRLVEIRLQGVTLFQGVIHQQEWTETFSVDALSLPVSPELAVLNRETPDYPSPDAEDALPLGVNLKKCSWVYNLPAPPLDPAVVGGYAGKIELRAESPVSLQTGKDRWMKIEITNMGTARWTNTEDNRASAGSVAVGLIWSREGEPGRIKEERWPLPVSLEPGESTMVEFKLKPDTTMPPGRYEIHLALVHDAFTWFPDKGGPKLVWTVSVEKAVP